MRPLDRNERPVLPCGRLNFTTGANDDFNVLTDWEPGDSSLTLFKLDLPSWSTDKVQFRIVAGSGVEDDLKDEVYLAHDQTHARIGGFYGWRKVAHALNTREGLDKLRDTLRENKSRCAAMCVLK